MCVCVILWCTFFSIDAIRLKQFLVKQKFFGVERKKFFFDGKPKKTKKFEFENLKISKNDQIPFLGILKF